MLDKTKLIGAKKIGVKNSKHRRKINKTKMLKVC